MVYDKNLIGVDPWDPNLSLNMKARVVNEVINNYWYFVREVIRVIVPGGKIPYMLHRGNLAEAFCMLNNINQILCLPRQHFKTQSGAIVYLWMILFKAKNYQLLFGHKALSGSQDNLKRVKDAMDGLPSYLLSGVDKQRDVFNVESILIKSRNNQIKLLGSPGNAAAADKQGRGATVPVVWLDEFAFLKYNNIMFGSLVPANSTASEIARRNGTPYGILITTTPNNLDSDDGAYCKSMIDMAWKFDEHIYDRWFENDELALHDFIDSPENSANGFVYIEFSYKQLGKDDVWLNKQKRALQGDLSLVKRELLLEWTLGSNTSPFSEEQLDRLSDGIIKEPYGRLLLLEDKYKITLLKPMHNMMNKNYIVSIDVAGGLGRDASAITIIDPATQEIMGVFKNNYIPITDLSDLLQELVSIYLPNAVLIPERNNGGITLIELLEKTSADKNLYYRVKTSNGMKKITQDTPNILDGKKSVLNKGSITVVKGVDTTVKTREIMINEILFNIVNNRPELINNDSILDEIKTLERKKNGKIEHAAGKHDDQLFSYLIGLYPLLFDTNIGRFITNLSDGLGDSVGGPTEVDNKSIKIKRRVQATLDLSRQSFLGVNSSGAGAGLLNSQPKLSLSEEERKYQDKLNGSSRAKGLHSSSLNDSLSSFRNSFINK